MVDEEGISDVDQSDLFRANESNNRTINRAAN
jgi:hypothetical protein